MTFLFIIFIIFYTYRLYLNLLYLSKQETTVIENMKLGYQIIKIKRNGFIPVCDPQYLIIKKNFIFFKEVYNIGCNDFNLLQISDKNFTIIKKDTDFFKNNTKYDTIIITFK